MKMYHNHMHYYIHTYTYILYTKVLYFIELGKFSFIFISLHNSIKWRKLVQYNISTESKFILQIKNNLFRRKNLLVKAL